jgi:ubiquinone/menaquinone biosynthesis C-methylase UbiE
LRLGGPARYFALRFNCRVTGIDITPAFVAAGNRLTAFVGLEDWVTIEKGDGQHLSYLDRTFDGAYTQHVTMNVADRRRFFGEAAYRVLRPAAGHPHPPWRERAREDAQCRRNIQEGRTQPIQVISHKAATRT